MVRAQRAAAHVARTGVSSVVVDCEACGPGAVRLGLARQLADALGADHLDLGEVAATSLTNAVRNRTTAPRGRVA